VHSTDADVVVCSSSGWAHGIASDVPKVVYCHNPARWLYQPDDYFRGKRLLRSAMAPLLWWLRGIDQRAAGSCDAYIANSRAVTVRINTAYGIDATTISPPTSFAPHGAQRRVVGAPPEFFLCVGRLLSYKRVDMVIDAFRVLPHLNLVVVGEGPLADELLRSAPPNVTLVGAVDDDQLRWLYHQATALVSSSSEDFGLTPVEAASCGTPSVLLRSGGFLDTCIEGTNGFFFDEPTAPAIAGAINTALTITWDQDAIAATADRYSIERFVESLTEVAGRVTK
jgi:glycosyltransferase involved in cell wall biosynthesis